MTHRSAHLGLLTVLIAALGGAAPAQPANVDITACRGMYLILKSMRDGAPRDRVAASLDSLLATPPYQVMFRHYNRSWRPNHLPPDVFKRMILGLGFDGAYTPGENERADAMRSRWRDFYPDLTAYESQLRQLEAADLPKLIDEGVRFAQSWLPPGWAIPDFTLLVIPNGGSPAFALEGVQGYDFLQLAQGRPGQLDAGWLVGTVAHESHHLGMQTTAPDSLSPADLMAFRVVNLCVAEGVATEFISGPPAGRAPAYPEARFHLFPPDLAKVWRDRVAEEEAMVDHQVGLLDRAVGGRLTEEEFNTELRDYWLAGAVGRAYVLGADMVGAIYAAFGKEGVFAVMRDPRLLFERYDAALRARPDVLAGCARVPDSAVAQALAIGSTKRAPAR